jgi:phosphatidylglycerol---prolipoprotein diacylglyceryl transferase
VSNTPVLRTGSHPEWHIVFESLAYSAGFALYRHLKRSAGDVLQDAQRWHVIAAAVLGSLLGSRLLDLLYEMPTGRVSWMAAFAPAGGKTIIGGLLGGWLGVELLKKAEGISTRTGDLFAVPLCLGIVVGRIGCFLTGLQEDTYGQPTGLPWGVDFGDGVPRHPTQIYEILFVAGLGSVLWLWQKRPHVQGVLFRRFMTGYLGWRLAIDFLKPEPLWFGLSVLQWACAVGLIFSFL